MTDEIMRWEDEGGAAVITSARFVCRDIGYGIETGIVELPALGIADWTRKRPYRTDYGDVVYLFDDEVRA